MQRGSVLPMLLILVLVILLGGGVYWFFLKKPTVSTPAPVSQIPQNNELSPAPSDSSAQEVFDDLLGIRFSLPRGFKLVKETEEEYFKRANGNIRKNFDGYVFYAPAEFIDSLYVLPDSESNLDKAVLTVWAFNNPDNLNTQKFYEKYWYYPFVWGDFTSRKEEIAPKDIELIDGKEGKFGIVGYREGKPEFIYLPLTNKNLMLQIQTPTESPVGKEMLSTFKFE